MHVHVTLFSREACFMRSCKVFFYLSVISCSACWITEAPELKINASLVTLSVTILSVQVMLNAAPAFLNVFHRLVASVMQEGRQRGAEGDTGSASDSDRPGSNTERLIHQVPADEERDDNNGPHLICPTCSDAAVVSGPACGFSPLLSLRCSKDN